MLRGPDRYADPCRHCSIGNHSIEKRPAAAATGPKLGDVRAKRKKEGASDVPHPQWLCRVARGKLTTLLNYVRDPAGQSQILTDGDRSSRQPEDTRRMWHTSNPILATFSATPPTATLRRTGTYDTKKLCKLFHSSILWRKIECCISQHSTISALQHRTAATSVPLDGVGRLDLRPTDVNAGQATLAQHTSGNPPILRSSPRQPNTRSD